MKEKTTNTTRNGRVRYKPIPLNGHESSSFSPELLEFEQFLRETFHIETFPRKSFFQKERLFDIFFSSLVIVSILSWVYPILYILIKMESRGPVLFVQQRNGLHEKPFNCYKFRSMTVNDLSDILPTMESDCRITVVGKIIRKLSIDELPQFINVLKGEMSVVGPRPHMLSETELFHAMVEQFPRRHIVKPGITGLAQINGSRGFIGNKEDLKERLKYDLLYIKNKSLRYDVKIIAKTMVQCMAGDKKAC